MFEPRPEMSMATRFLRTGFSAIPSPSKIEMPAKFDARFAALFDHFAELHNGFPVGRQEIARRAHNTRIQHRNHTDTAVEGAQHLLLADIAGIRQPLEYREYGNAGQ